MDTRAGARSWHPLPGPPKPGTESGSRSAGPPRGRGRSGAMEGDPRLPHALRHPKPCFQWGPNQAPRQSRARRGNRSTARPPETRRPKPGRSREHPPSPRPGRAGSRPALRPLGLARTFAPGGGLAVQARVDGVGFPALTPVRQPHSLALTYPSWPSGWCPAAPTLCPAAASGRSAGRTTLPGRWAVHRNREAPRAPVAPYRPLLWD